MGRRRQYASEAERQRAYRLRREQESVRVDREALARLHQRLDQLQAAVVAAAAAGEPTARACRAASVETVLENLIGYFQARSQPRGQQDAPVATPAAPRGRRSS